MVYYEYDAWGRHCVSGANGKAIDDLTHIGHMNPFRYRSYYYDTETGLYFLKTRYYDPEIGRFISQDSIEYADPETINGINLYAYCGNNPVMGYDPTGTFWDKVRDWFSTITGLLNRVSKIAAAGAVIVAMCQGKWNELAADWNNGCFNPFNMDESVALNSNVFSFYKGESVIRHSIPGTTSGQLFGNIFLNTSVKDDAWGANVLNHEFGHGIQERFLGLRYITRIAIPSVIGYLINPSDYIYYSFPWERTADWFGGVKRSTGYKKNSLGWAFAENILGVGVIPFYFIFGY